LKAKYICLQEKYIISSIQNHSEIPIFQFSIHEFKQAAELKVENTTLQKHPPPKPSQTETRSGGEEDDEGSIKRAVYYSSPNPYLMLHYQFKQMASVG